MIKVYFRALIAAVAISSFIFGALSCKVVATPGEYYGSTTPPSRNILRYVNGDEPESLDPPVSPGQPEARIYMALYQGLVEYDPRTLNPIPALADRWDINNDSSEFVFHMRRDARWSNGDPITAADFVYSIRRGLEPTLASKTAFLAYYIVNAEAYNNHQVFVKDKRTGKFLLAQDVADSATPTSAALSQRQLTALDAEYETGTVGPDSGNGGKPAPGPDTAFHQSMHSPQRLTLPGDAADRNKLLAKDSKLQAAVAGIDSEFVYVSAEDVGLEAIDDYTVRISLSQPAPYFTGMLAHQFFRLAPRKIIEKYGNHWTDPEHIVTCGPFKVKAWLPYNELVVERDPMYWDAAKVGLDEIHFFVTTDNPTGMNLYKVGEADAVLNHTVPNAWLKTVQSKKDYMDGAEAAIVFININVSKPPMNDVRVRRAFDASIDKVNYSKSRRVTKPLSAFTPEGIFAGYPQPKINAFDPELARKLLGEAGYPVTKNSDGTFECKSFPIAQVEFIFNTNSSNKAMAEYMQAQWKQVLGVTVPLRSMEMKTYMNTRSKLDYSGFAVGNWGADYMDPFTFLSLFTTLGGVNGSGWFDPKYVQLLDEANRTLDHAQRYELLAKAEKYLLEAQPVIPLETTSVNWLKKPYVKGMYPNAASLYAWKYVYIEREPSKWDYGTPSLSDK